MSTTGLGLHEYNLVCGISGFKFDKALVNPVGPCLVKQ